MDIRESTKKVGTLENTRGMFLRTRNPLTNARISEHVMDAITVFANGRVVHVFRLFVLKMRLKRRKLLSMYTGSSCVIYIVIFAFVMFAVVVLYNMFVVCAILIRWGLAFSTHSTSDGSRYLNIS